MRTPCRRPWGTVSTVAKKTERRDMVGVWDNSKHVSWWKTQTRILLKTKIVCKNWAQPSVPSDCPVYKVNLDNSDGNKPIWNLKNSPKKEDQTESKSSKTNILTPKACFISQATTAALTSFFIGSVVNNVPCYISVEQVNKQFLGVLGSSSTHQNTSLSYSLTEPTAHQRPSGHITYIPEAVFYSLTHLGQVSLHYITS